MNDAEYAKICELAWNVQRLFARYAAENSELLPDVTYEQMNNAVHLAVAEHAVFHELGFNPRSSSALEFIADIRAWALRGRPGQFASFRGGKWNISEDDARTLAAIDYDTQHSNFATVVLLAGNRIR